MSHHKALLSYVVGFVLSIVLTLVAYLLVTNPQTLSPQIIITSIVVLGVVQLVVQLFFFLHVNEESRPRWNLVALLFAIFIVVIVVGGSLWIMHHLNYNMMTASPIEIDAYMQDQ